MKWYALITTKRSTWHRLQDGRSSRVDGSGEPECTLGEVVLDGEQRIPSIPIDRSRYNVLSKYFKLHSQSVEVRISNVQRDGLFTIFGMLSQ